MSASGARISARRCSFVRAEGGSIAIVFAFALIILSMCIGMAVDYARAMNVQSQIQRAADAAVLAAGRDPFLTAGEASQIAQTYFAGNTGGLGQARPAVVISRTGDEVTARATIDVPSTFMKLLGLDAIPVSAVAKAGIDLGETEIYAAVDMSASLGIAATPQARADLELLTQPYMPVGSFTPQGCEFACHQADGWEPAGKTAYQMAREAGIPLREDVLGSAFGSFVDAFMSAADPAVAANLKRMAVIGFSDDAQLLAAPSSNSATVKAALATFPAVSRKNTKLAPSLGQIRALVGAQGTGRHGSPRKTLLLITDGMGHERNGDPAFSGPIDIGLCEAFKNDGITVAVIDVQYQDATGEHWFDLQVAPHYPAISPALQDCASPGFYFLATDSDATSLGTAFSQAGDALRTKLVLRQ